jgi:hypothetical protein
MSQVDKPLLKNLREEITELPLHQPLRLKQHITDVIKAFNYTDIKVHGHLNELLLTINTEQLPDPENFNDIRTKLIYLIDTIISDY